MSRTTRLLSAAALSTALAATTLAGTGAVTGGAQAAEGDPVITLRADDEIVGYAFRKRAYIDLGLNAVTGDDALEIRSHRTGYDDPIVTTWSSGERSGTLPAGTQKDFGSLPGFVKVNITQDGELLDTKRVGACFNNGGTRVRPDGEASNPYPWGCPMLPLTVGSVQGLPAGWSVPVAGEFGGFRTRLAEGSYDVTMRIGTAYADAFGLSRADRTHTATLTVQRYDEEEYRRAARAQRAERTAGDGVPSYRPGPRPTSRREGVTDGPRPDLRSLPAFDIALNRRGTQLRFAANVWNAGPSPLLVDGFREGDEDHMQAYQYFFDTEGNQVGYEQIGEFHFHGANHQHWHYQDFARYRLLDADRQPVVRSKKVSFCLANTDAVDYTVPGADWHPEGTDLSTACGGPSAPAIRQVLSSGSGDTYLQFRAGQALPVKDLANGVYYVSVEANPFGRILESDSTNNVALRRIRLSGTGAERRVRVQQYSMVDESRGYYY
jgi:hypothetical protein